MDRMERPYLTVDVERRGYGRRYTELPVDSLSREGFAIDFAGAYMRPEWIDIRQGDIVRWRDGERRVQARVAEVRREGAWLHVRVEGVFPLPPEAFFP
ncbi:MAG: hypothetical protein IPP13_09985 [Kouleothrix sp.]|jgi:hypothetical protein|nr:hypothetical protein [Kouleothrix sp.]